MNPTEQSRIDGRQISWESANKPADQPLITIITSTFNAAKDLHWTGDSIRKQTYPYIQWIIADGASADDTLSVVKQYEDIIDLWFSEPDQGIYDAWNKALRHAKGEWIQFIGAGDELADPDTLEKMASVLAKAHPFHDLVYGNLLLVSEIKRQVIDIIDKPWCELKNEWTLLRPQLPPHPATFHHKSLFVANEPFDIRLRISGDSYLMMESILNKEPEYFDLLIDRMPIGGVSGKLTSGLGILLENRQISKELGYQIPLCHQFYEFPISLLKLLVVTIFSKKIGLEIADMFRLACGEKKRWSVK
ncbi:glycosyl transferase [Desulfocapsa sulfexigens DSM 10523]|uniref:Glycosyl transferase n=1 Tax=Desulfocapsa sulfexigens (strain DSM 10523 / SB164P1) TaxID=1167006 RepID=M1P5M7_DESSD|nr:glycosyltransferase family 2 protein [Desulfocapsa sulfexigens]AGF78798.1 glycosyl transferase [Desulfocapsa sulfexigens DSM 10523]